MLTKNKKKKTKIRKLKTCVRLYNIRNVIKMRVFFFFFVIAFLDDKQYFIPYKSISFKTFEKLFTIRGILSY